MKRPRGPARRLRRFDDGGPVRQVDTSTPPITPGPNAQIYQPKTESMGSQIGQGIQQGLNIGQAVNKIRAGDSKGDNVEPYKRGGTIKRTYGPKIGKEDGIIAAQKGEYVVRKSAVNKLGKKTLDTINKGKLPDKGARRGR